jgi:hypothetical protein
MSVRHILICVLFMSCAPSLSLRANACPRLPTDARDSKTLLDVSSVAVVKRYFQASKEADAKTAVTLVDYDEWAKDMNLAGANKKEWIKEHRDSLQASYDMHKREGSSKEFKILSITTVGTEQVFIVSQSRAAGDYIWEVRAIRKGGSWRIKGFDLQKVKAR